MVNQYNKYKGHQNCAFAKSRGKLTFFTDELTGELTGQTFGTNYDYEYVPAPGFELVPENWDVRQWEYIDENGKTKYQVCDGMQKILTAVRNWGESYCYGCNSKWSEEKKHSWFPKLYNKLARDFERDLPKKLEGQYKVLGCLFDRI
jgi:hypothetical protein